MERDGMGYDFVCDCLSYVAIIEVRKWDEVD